MTDAEIDNLLAQLASQPPSVPLSRVHHWVRTAEPPSRFRYLTVWLARIGLTRPN